MGAQILLGALTSANFAASACQTLPDCHGSWLPGSNLATAFDLSREHQVGETGIVLGGPELADIHKLHRLVAALTVLSAVVVAVLAVRAHNDLRIFGYIVLSVVILEFVVGVSAILTDIPIGVAVAHNWLAGILLLVLLKLHAESRYRAILGPKFARDPPGYEPLTGVRSGRHELTIYEFPEKYSTLQ